MRNEAETRAELIDPALHQRGWTEDLIKREVTDGGIEIINGRPRRSRKRVDYTLRVRPVPGAQPVTIALIEAKKEEHHPTHGLQQGKQYAKAERLNVPFVFSSNGHQYVVFGRSTGQTSQPQPMNSFPTPAELRARYEEAVGFGLDEEVAQPLLEPYPGGETTRRYYQDAALRAVLEQTARQRKRGEPPRALLAMATGSGKTRVAIHLFKRFYDAGTLRRGLFLVDRDELRTQALGRLQSIFGSDVRQVTTLDPQKNARIVVATYQTLGLTVEDDASFLVENYPENHFSHIVIDECHRSAWGEWSEVLERNFDAVQVGLTATPRQLDFDEDTEEARRDEQITADNHAYFGEPAYEYDLGQAIADGYLAACEIRRGRVDIDDTGLTIEEIMAREPVDARTGQPLTTTEVQAAYEAPEYESKIMLPDRVMAMCDDLFQYLLDTGGPEQKTIIFCVRDTHADAVAIELNNRYHAWCRENDVEPKADYAFKCTSAEGKDLVPELKGSRTSHFIATTVDLLSTGVDVPPLRNVVIFRYLNSPILLNQMVGRGTRLHPETGKLMFRVYDYTDATRLLSDEFVTTDPTEREGGGDGAVDDHEPPTIVSVQGFDVGVTEAGRFIVAHIDGETQRVTVEEYKDHLAAKLLEEVPTLNDLRTRWIDPRAREELMNHLPEHGQSAKLIRRLEEMDDYDLYDVLGELGYGMNPRTRLERSGAFTYKNSGWLQDLPDRTRRTLQALVDQFAQGGVEALESRSVFQAPAVRSAGGLPALQALGDAAQVLRETKERLFKA